MYYNDCGDGSSAYGTEYGRNIPRPLLIERMIEIHNQDATAHPKHLAEFNEIKTKVDNIDQHIDERIDIALTEASKEGGKIEQAADKAVIKAFEEGVIINGNADIQQG